MSALSHTVEVTEDTHGPLAEVAAVAALKRSAAALGIALGEARTVWSDTDPFDVPEVEYLKPPRFVTATAPIEW